MSQVTEFPAEVIEAMSGLIDLPIAPEYRDGVAQNLARLMSEGALLLTFPLPAEIEPAPVFVP